jgi:PAS domain-containing protein
LRLATEAAEVGTWDLNLATDVLTWSDRTKAAFGISPEVACSMEDFYAGLHPEDREATGEAFASALDPARRATYDVEYRNDRAGGRGHPVGRRQRGGACSTTADAATGRSGPRSTSPRERRSRSGCGPAKPSCAS